MVRWEEVTDEQGNETVSDPGGVAPVILIGRRQINYDRRLLHRMRTIVPQRKRLMVSSSDLKSSTEWFQ